MKVIAIYPGRYQPPHRGHLSVYDYLCGKFGEGNVFIATTDAQAPVTSPFSFSDKVQLWTKLGVPASKIVQVKSPYNPVEITREVPDPENTALVIAVSEKDMQGDSARFKFGTKRDGSPSYLQPFPEDAAILAPMTEHGYVLTIPTTNFKVGGIEANSASQIRAAYINGSPEDQEDIIHGLYGDADTQIKQTFDRRLRATEKAVEALKEARKVLKNGVDPKTRAKVLSLVESIRNQEAAREGDLFKEDLQQDYWRER